MGADSIPRPIVHEKPGCVKARVGRNATIATGGAKPDIPGMITITRRIGLDEPDADPTADASVPDGRPVAPPNPLRSRSCSA